jgi:hypothetical protein
MNNYRHGKNGNVCFRSASLENEERKTHKYRGVNCNLALFRPPKMFARQAIQLKNEKPKSLRHKEAFRLKASLLYLNLFMAPSAFENFKDSRECLPGHSPMSVEVLKAIFNLIKHVSNLLRIFFPLLSSCYPPHPNRRPHYLLNFD